MKSHKSHIQAVQSIVPSKVTDPRLTRKVSVAGGTENLGGCLHVVLYYSKSPDAAASGWSVAGFIKDSLGRALTEQPFLAGRLRRLDVGDGEYEVVSNDGGVRLVEAKMDASLSEVLVLKGDEKEGVEAELVFWKEIDEHYPQFSPLFYVQVTNFKCGGYSVAISCSLLLADNVVTTKFLGNWANKHEAMLSETNLPTLPIFYAPNQKRTTSSPTIPLSSTSSPRTRGRSMKFKAALGQDGASEHAYKGLALLCLEEAGHNLGRNVGSDKITFFVKGMGETVTVESCRDGRGMVELVPRVGSGVEEANWENLEGKGVAFVKGSDLTHVSHWIGSASGRVVMAGPSGDGPEFLNVIVTFVDDRKKVVEF